MWGDWDLTISTSSVLLQIIFRLILVPLLSSCGVSGEEKLVTHFPRFATMIFNRIYEQYAVQPINAQLRTASKCTCRDSTEHVADRLGFATQT